MTAFRLSHLRLAGTVAACIAVGACAYQEPSPNVPAYGSYPAQPQYPQPQYQQPYSPPPVSRGQVVEPRYARNTGVVNSIELVRGEESRGVSAGGAIIGAVAGGLLGNQIGEGRGRTAATIAGAAGGALAGNAIGQRTQSTPDVYRVGIQYDGGGTQYIDVPTPGDLRTGDRVRVDNGQISRY